MLFSDWLPRLSDQYFVVLSRFVIILRLSNFAIANKSRRALFPIQLRLLAIMNWRARCHIAFDKIATIRNYPLFQLYILYRHGAWPLIANKNNTVVPNLRKWYKTYQSIHTNSAIPATDKPHWKTALKPHSLSGMMYFRVFKGNLLHL